MKKLIALILMGFIAVITFTACSNDAAKDSGGSSVAQGDKTVENVYVDKNYEPGFDYKLCYVSKDLTGNVGIVDSGGNIVIEPSYLSILPVDKGRFVVEKTIDNYIHSALIDDKENILIPFFKGVIGETGVIAPEGTPPILAVEPTFGKTRFVNTDGEQIIPLEFDGASIHQYDGFFFGKKNTEAGKTLYVYDYNGKEICVLNNGDYAELRELEHGYTLLIGNNNNWLKFGLKNSSGKVIIPCKYEEIKVVGADRIVAFDGELESLIETSNVANMFDGDGKQLTKDGEFARIFFDDGDKIGIGCQSATLGAYEPEFWLIDLNGKAESGKYDSIDKDADGNFVCKKGDKTETIKSVK